MKEFYAIKSQGKRTLFTFLIFLSLVSLNTKSQVTYISATGDGGFETGTSFASNGWSVANHNSGNRSWYVGTGQAGYTGNRCAFIGNSSTSVGTTNSARTVHLYRSITIPLGATNIQLTFKYKQATSDFISPTYYDYIAVYTDTNTPTEGNLPGGTLQFGPYPNTSVSTFTTQNVTLPNSLAGTTTNLIFTFKANGASPHAYGAVDDVSLTYTAPPACTTPTAQPTLLSLTPGSTTVTGSFTAASPAPSNYLIVRNTSGVAPSPINTTSYTIGSTALGGTNVVVDNDTNTSFSDTGLTVNTTYYYFIFSFNNNACSGGPLYLSTSPLNGNTTTVPNYCSSTGTTFSNGISGVTFNTINNINTAVNVAYTDYTAQNTTVIKGSTYNLNIYVSTGGNFTDYQTAWFDWNRDGDFTDSGETYELGTAKNVTNQLSSLSPYPILIPYHASTGTIRMRIQSKYDSTSTSCETGFDGETEDYTITVTNNATACATPTTQPTGLTLTADGTNITGSFTPATPAPTNYLVVMNTTGVSPTPVNGTTYQIGTTISAGNTVVDNDTDTTFLANGLTTATTYYFYVFSANTVCTGGTQYNLVAPLIANTTTTSNNYCTSSSLRNDIYISSIESVGTLADNINASGYSPKGFGNYSNINIATQIPNGGININIGLAETQFITAYVDWNNDKDFADAGEKVYTTINPPSNNVATGDTSFGFVVPAAQAVGTYRMRIMTMAYGEGANITLCATNDTTGETEDYSITIVADCAQKITSVTNGSACGPTNTVNLSAVSAGATGFRWYSTSTGNTLLQQVVGSGSWTTPSISSTTTYYVTAYNGTCESKYRTAVKATILPTSNITITPSTPLACGEDNTISILANGDTIEEDIFTEDFEDGINSLTASTGTPYTNPGTDTPWSIKTSTYQPTSTSVWRPAVNSGEIGSTSNKFAFTTSDYSNSNIVTIMTSPVINTSIYSSLTLTFDHYYSYYGGDSGTIQVSTDGGTSWSTAVATYNSDLGSASSFTEATVNLSTYAGQSNLRFRFVYTGSWDDGWAVDNILLKGIKPLNTTFTWSGATVDAYTDAACLTPYTGQSVNQIWVKPTLAQLESPNWSFNANATLGNSCPITKVVSVTNNTKIWKGTTDNDWNKASNWLPAVIPDLNTCVIIPANTIISGSNYNAYGKNLTVKSTGNLELQQGNNLIINDWIDVKTGGTFNIRNNANLVQINDTPSQANSGSINMDRTATGLKQFDYIYWSSPVNNFPVTSVSPYTATNKIYHWVPDVNNGSGTPPTYGYGNWANVNENMIDGKGYIIRVPNANTTFSTTFTGLPKNGVVTRTVTRGPYTGADYTGANGLLITNTTDNFNLVGNPYPSAIDAVEFLTANAGVIAQKVHLWTHSTAISNTIQSPYYQSFIYNYTSNDYVTYNNLGNNVGVTTGFNGKIGAGQGFFVEMLDGAAGTNTITFNNSMRTDDSNNAYNNGQFYRNAEKPDEKHRIWLDLVDSNFKTSRFMVGYATGASNDRDQMFDANTNYQEPLKAFSIINDEIFNIQGKALPFDSNDQINIGFQVPAQGTYKFAIADADGMFKDRTQKVYLQDLLTNTLHDLTTAPYSFNSDKGLFKNRFILKYTNQTLSNNENEFSKGVIVYSTDQLTITSELFNIKEVVIYDILGKTLFSDKKLNTKNSSLNINKNNTALLVKITLENGAVITKKIIH